MWVLLCSYFFFGLAATQHAALTFTKKSLAFIFSLTALVIHSLIHSSLCLFNSFNSPFSLPHSLSGGETGSGVLSDQRIPVTPFHGS